MEIGFLKPLLDHSGPWASVYLDTSRATADAAKLRQLRERSVADRLVEQGVDTPTRSAVLERLAAEPVSRAPAGRAVFATGGEVVLDLPLDASPLTVDTWWSALPHVAPLMGLLGEEPLCLVAYVDRGGVDMELRAPHGREPVGQAEGRDWQGRGHRTVPSDRAEWHYRNRVENQRNRTAEMVAAELARRWPGSGAQLLVLVGDPRERRAVYGRLPEQLRGVTVEVDGGGRAAGASTRLLDRQIAELCERYVRERLEEFLSRFRAGRGRPGEHGALGVDTGPGGAAEGMPAVVDAARGRQVAALLLGRAGADPARSVWVGPEPEQVAVQRGQVRAMGVPEPVAARADDALLRCAAAADAEVLAVPDDVAGPVGGLGAVLRWAV
ncbi:baeRF2 domain-containing protein [Peterkaempfera bronchialis]|uniref:Peptide chain release factor 1 n=1 Tax=Peterkaempfera bronchialis TaxID=2126346 RepID=A0A345SXC3_9ACTN|nr:hypothetical protein [Peterkaempfera bronchialis]AXI78378.1 hypothetical protein C7M71_013970 [Peterkaempfera bronchialis]